MNKQNDSDWFKLTCDKSGTKYFVITVLIISRWSGICWFYYKRVRYEFKVEFEVAVLFELLCSFLPLIL